jgi:hypothetical protein
LAAEEWTGREKVPTGAAELTDTDISDRKVAHQYRAWRMADR